MFQAIVPQKAEKHLNLYLSVANIAMVWIPSVMIPTDY
jgi:hypothetical protein